MLWVSPCRGVKCTNTVLVPNNTEYYLRKRALYNTTHYNGVHGAAEEGVGGRTSSVTAVSRETLTDGTTTKPTQLLWERQYVTKRIANAIHTRTFCL